MVTISLVLSLALSLQLSLGDASWRGGGYVNLDLPNVDIHNTVIGTGNGNIVGNHVTSVDGGGNVVANIQGDGNNVIASSDGHGNVLADIHGNGVNIINGVVVGVTVTTTLTTCPNGVSCTGQTLTWTAITGKYPCTGLPCVYVLPSSPAAKSCNGCTQTIQATAARCNGTDTTACTSKYIISTQTVTAQSGGATSSAKSSGSDVVTTETGGTGRLQSMGLLTGTSLGLAIAAAVLLF